MKIKSYFVSFVCVFFVMHSAMAAESVKNLSIEELNALKPQSGKFYVEGYVVGKKPCPCPLNNPTCRPCPPDYVLITTDPWRAYYDTDENSIYLRVRRADRFQEREKYQFLIKAVHKKNWMNLKDHDYQVLEFNKTQEIIKENVRENK